jgi:hypothetical protein
MTTLVEELEQAADDIEDLSHVPDARSARAALRLRADHLRQRAAWVRELEAKVGTGSAGLGGCDSWTFRALTGPIPSETAPAAQPVSDPYKLPAPSEVGGATAGEAKPTARAYCPGCDGGCEACRSNPPQPTTGQQESLAAPSALCPRCGDRVTTKFEAGPPWNGKTVFVAHAAKGSSPRVHCRESGQEPPHEARP